MRPLRARHGCPCCSRWEPAPGARTSTGPPPGLGDVCALFAATFLLKGALPPWCVFLPAWLAARLAPLRPGPPIPLLQVLLPAGPRVNPCVWVQTPHSTQRTGPRLPMCRASRLSGAARWSLRGQWGHSCAGALGSCLACRCLMPTPAMLECEARPRTSPCWHQAAVETQAGAAGLTVARPGASGVMALKNATSARLGTPRAPACGATGRGEEAFPADNGLSSSCAPGSPRGLHWGPGVPARDRRAGRGAQ
jgi:hypothetical protein